MIDKETYFVKLTDTDNPQKSGWGECAIFRGLSAEDSSTYLGDLKALLEQINRGLLTPEQAAASANSSVRFGLETAIADLKSAKEMMPFPSAWSEGKSEIEINGLIWMGNAEEMRTRIKSKIESGFMCIKLKIGGIDFNNELELLRYIRSEFSAQELTIRLDANGAFTQENALFKLDALSRYGIHSIEQPIKQGQIEAMSRICAQSPIPIALDEELIGCTSDSRKRELLSTIKPHYIILKPSLCGGFAQADNWIETARSLGIGWWATSALESDIGLNAIAQWTSLHNINLPQGLGTGNLYTNNIKSPLVQTGQVLKFNPEAQWKLPELNWIL
ncbi:MAG: o-succinylbenzoate synthase [Muribaculum sp.]|nr:o-succinylbenzoate synthase [Muribaculaceae bacterium]MCM1080941.1 o-succinylbenzoate synthase [Muribaculum sp.]